MTGDKAVLVLCQRAEKYSLRLRRPGAHQGTLAAAWGELEKTQAPAERYGAPCTLALPGGSKGGGFILKFGKSFYTWISGMGIEG